ncbi:DUF1828 domain-containing protein [Acidocella sp.]|uniref:DUF1828 domain-containing protein n=1 Tax=Acidocella sp. TaxID=50710 RepID=UPI003CFE0C83
MNLHDRLCEAFCKNFTIREVPIGFSIKTPFRWHSGDFLAFYARTSREGLRFEDDGLTVSELEGAGVDITTGARFEMLQDMLASTGVKFDQDEFLFYTDYVHEDRSGLLAISFLEFMLRVQEFLLTARTRTASTFRDDLIAALVERFGVDSVQVNEAPISALSYYVVDIVVRHRSGKMAAIFPGTTEAKALEAVLFSKEIELKSVSNVVPFLIVEDSEFTKISRQTRSKAINSDLQMGAWGGGQLDVIDKVEKHVKQIAS